MVDDLQIGDIVRTYGSASYTPVITSFIGGKACLRYSDGSTAVQPTKDLQLVLRIGNLSTEERTELERLRKGAIEGTKQLNIALSRVEVFTAESALRQRKIDELTRELDRLRNAHVDLNRRYTALLATGAEDGKYYSESKGTFVTISEMPDAHLRNALKKAKRETGEYPKNLLAEWERRGLGI